MKWKRILAMILAVASCLSLAVSASAANTVTRKATDFKDYDRTAWYAEAVSAAVDNGLLYGKSSTVIDPNGAMTRAEMAAIINRSFGCYKTADISQYKDVSKSAWYYKDVALAVQMGTYNGRSSSAMAPDAPISRQEAMTVVARALELDYDAYAKTDLSKFADRDKISAWALPYIRAMVGADYIHGRGKNLAPLDNITRAEFAQIFANIIGSYITVKGSYDKDIKGSVLIRTDDVTLQNMTVDGDLIIGCGAADGKITLDNVTVTGRLLVWGGGTKAVYCNAGTNMPAVVVARVDDAVKVIYDRDSTLAVIDTIKVRITERAKAFKETEVVFYDVSGLREAQKQLNAIVADNQIDITAPAHLYAIVGETNVKADFGNSSKSDTYKIEIRRNKDNALIADAFELAAGKSISTLTLLEAPEFGNTDCIVTITAYWCSGSGSYHALIPAAAEAWGLPVSGCTASEPQRITDALSSGKLVVAIMSAGHFTSSGHFIVLRGVKDEKILVADPASRTRSEQSWELSIILNEASKAAGSGGPFWIIG